MDAVINVRDFANMIIIARFAGFIGAPIGWLLGEGLVLLLKKVKERRQKKKVDAVIE